MLTRLLPTTGVFQIFRQGQTRHYQRSLLRERIRHEPALRLLPSLLGLPLAFDSTIAHASSLLKQGNAIALHGGRGSGRSLALLQLAWQWLASNRPEPVVLLHLAYTDDDNRSPREILVQRLQEEGVNGDSGPLSEAALAGAGLLLLDGWEELAPHRRAAWADLLEKLPRLLPAAHVVLALPVAPAATHGMAADTWNAYHAVLLTPPGGGLLATWLEYLLPNYDPAPILAALVPGAPLASLRGRLFDIALLVLVYPRYRLPASRTQLYEWTAALCQQQNVPLASSAHRTADPDAPLLLPGFWLAQCYLLAREMLSSGDYSPFATLEPAARYETARMLRGMVPNPAPLYAALWEAHDLYTLAACLSEQPTAAPVWGVRVLEAIVEQHTEAAPSDLAALSQFAASLSNLATSTPASMQSDTDPLALLVRHLPTMLVKAGNVLGEEQITTLLHHLALPLGRTALLDLIDQSTARAALRWAAADALLLLVGRDVRSVVLRTLPPDTLARAIRYYLLALGDEEDRGMLAVPEIANWAAALLDAQVSQQYRDQVAGVVQNDPRLADELATTAAALLAPADEQYNRNASVLLARACTDSETPVRHAAMAALHNQDSTQALAILSDMLLDATLPWLVLADALENLASWPQTRASTMLTRCILTRHLPLALRLRAVVLLSQRCNGQQSSETLLLRRLLHSTSLPPAVRVAAVHLLARQHIYSALPELGHLLQDSHPLPIRQAAALALGQMGATTTQARSSLQFLGGVLRHEVGNSALSCTLLHALGTLGFPAAIQGLHTLLRADLSRHVRAFWQTHAPTLIARFDQGQGVDWAELTALPLDLQRVLLDGLTTGTTDADQPSSASEFIATQTEQVRLAVLDALARLALAARKEARERKDSPDTADSHQTIRAMLLEALRDNPPERSIPHLLACLDRISTPDEWAAEDIEDLLTDEHLAPTVRWQIIEQLGKYLTAEPLLLRCLDNEALDLFTRGKIAAMLGLLSSLMALIGLRRLAEQPDTALYLRIEAVRALGMLHDPAIETSLLNVLGDTNAPVVLRAAAADALPANLRPQLRHWLRELVRIERQPPELLASILAALGRLQDREAIPLLLHYAQDHQPDIAIPALQALSGMSDDTVVPTLIRLAQDIRLEASTRLQAILALVRLRGREYIPLLRGYLTSNVLSLRLQAINSLLALHPEDPLPLSLLPDTLAPLALRVRALEALAARPESHHALHRLLLDSADDLHLRTSAALALRTSSHTQTVSVLQRCAANETSPLPLRWHCIAVLQSHATSDTALNPARVALSQLADDTNLLEVVREGAARALVHAALQGDEG